MGIHMDHLPWGQLEQSERSWLHLWQASQDRQHPLFVPLSPSGAES